MEISENVKNSYDNQYDPSLVEWRNKSAKYKAKNIVDLARNIQFSSVLEVGCGEGSILNWLSEWNFSDNLHGLEISKSGVELAKEKKIKHLKSITLFDGYTIPFEDNSFDLIICSHVMEHVEHERTLLREIRRVSKYQIFEVPIDFSFYVDRKANHFLSYGHINIYTPGLFRFLLLSEQFKIVKDRCYLYDNEVLEHLHRKNQTKLLITKIKYFILNTFPYLKGIKPSSYVVLSEKVGDQALSIFENK